MGHNIHGQEVTLLNMQLCTAVNSSPAHTCSVYRAMWCLFEGFVWWQVKCVCSLRQSRLECQSVPNRVTVDIWSSRSLWQIVFCQWNTSSFSRCSTKCSFLTLCLVRKNSFYALNSFFKFLLNNWNIEEEENTPQISQFTTVCSIIQMCEC